MRRFLPVVMILTYATCTCSTQAQTKSPPITPCTGESHYTFTDDGPYGQLIHESDPNKRLALLDNFVAQNKSSRSMLVYIFRSTPGAIAR